MLYESCVLQSLLWIVVVERTSADTRRKRAMSQACWKSERLCRSTRVRDVFRINIVDGDYVTAA
jgi:hypothetical protein